MKFPNPIRVDFGEGKAVRVRREEDAGFTAELVLLAYGWNTDTGREARRDPAGVLTGDPELVAAFPGLLAQRHAALRDYLEVRRVTRRIRALSPEIKAEVQRVNDGVRERAETLARQAQEAEDAGRLEEALARVEELERLVKDYGELFGLEG